MKLRFFSRHTMAKRVCALAMLLAAIGLFAGCSAWNPWGYKKEWPVWKKAAFFAGPGHCPACYVVGGGVIELLNGSDASGPATTEPDGNAPSAANQPSQPANDGLATKEVTPE